VLKTSYIGKGDSVFHTKGTFKWDESGSKITLDNTEKQIYQVGENKLFHLDKNGNRITGNLENNYIMEKEKTELTGKYWKLVRLNGKTVETTEREAFIRFDAEDNRVHGNSSCNTFNGKYELSEGNRIKFPPFAMTKMACIGNSIETEFMQVLGKTTNYSLTSNELILQDEFETTLAKFESDFFK
jgi:heat shock protein HslJ